VTPSGIESNYFKGVNILSPPGITEEPLYSARIKHNGSTYQLQMANATSLPYDTRVYLGYIKIGRIAAGTYPVGWITVYSETSNSDSLDVVYPSSYLTTPDQPLSFSYINTDGSESDIRTFYNVYYPNNSKITWSNTGLYGQISTTEQIGSGASIIKVYEKYNGAYTQKGSVTGANGFIKGITGADGGGLKITDDREAAYVYVNSYGNESPYIDDGIVPAAPSAAVANNLRLTYNAANYEVKNTGAAVNLTNKLRVYVGSQLIGATTSSSIGTSGFPSASSYVESDSSPVALSDALSLSGGSLQFTYTTPNGNESDFYNSAASVPTAPLLTNIYSACVKYDTTAGITYKLSANANVILAAGTRAYIGPYTIIPSAVAETINSGSFSTANSITANPDGSGGTLGFTTFANGNESARTNVIGPVPDRPDESKIKWLNGLSQFAIMSGQQVSTTSEKLKLYQKDGTTYSPIALANTEGPYTPGTNYSLGATPPLILAEKEAAFTAVSSISQCESSISAGGIVPAPPAFSQNLRTTYDTGMNYKLTNNSSTDDFVIPDGSKLNVYIDGILVGQRTASGANVIIPTLNGLSDFNLDLNYVLGGGNLTFTMSSASSNNESENTPVAPTMVPPKILFQASKIAPNDNSSGNVINYINQFLAMSVTQSPATDMQRLAVMIDTGTLNNGTAVLKLVNAGNSALLNYGITGPNSQTGEFTLTPGSPQLETALGNTNLTFLTSYLWATDASSGNASWYSLDGTIGYDVIQPQITTITAAPLAVDGAFAHDGNDKITINFSENINGTGVVETDFMLPVFGDTLGAGGISVSTTFKIEITATGGSPGVITRTGTYNQSVLGAASPSGMYFDPGFSNKVKDNAGNPVNAPVSNINAIDIQ